MNCGEIELDNSRVPPVKATATTDTKQHLLDQGFVCHWVLLYQCRHLLALVVLVFADWTCSVTVWRVVEWCPVIVCIVRHLSVQCELAFSKKKRLSIPNIKYMNIVKTHRMRSCQTNFCPFFFCTIKHITTKCQSVTPHMSCIFLEVWEDVKSCVSCYLSGKGRHSGIGT